jgi:hypothetical protein
VADAAGADPAAVPADADPAGADPADADPADADPADADPADADPADADPADADPADADPADSAGAAPGRAVPEGVIEASRWTRLSSGARLTDGGSSAGEVPHDDGEVPTFWAIEPPRAIADHGSQLRLVLRPLTRTRCG